jgi:TrmH RNA methyltransferase
MTGRGVKPPNRPPPKQAPKPAEGKEARERASDKALARIAGFSAVSALFAAAPERVERLFFDDKSKSRAKDFCQAMAKARKPYRLVPPEELDKIAGTPMHGGIVAVAQPRPVKSFDPDAARSWAKDGQLLLILDGIGNPHNLGAIMRTAAFFGAPRVVLSDHPQQAMPSDASYRVSEGGFEHVEVYRAAKFTEQLAKLRGAYRIIGAAPGGKASIPARKKGESPFALVLGNEEHGLPKSTLDVCGEIVAIEGAGQVESLNVSAAAAILIHALSGKPPA